MKTNLPRATPLVIVIAVAALFFSAAGGAVAGGLITGAQIKNNTVSTKDVKDGTLKTKDLSGSARLALAGQDGQDGVDGAPGGPGPAGPPGPPGTAGTNGTNGTNGSNGVSGYQRVTATGPAVVAGANTSVGAACPAGKKIVGATSEFVGGFEGTSIQFNSDTGATAFGINVGGGADSIRIVVVCVSAL
jgi:hypothetical protein